MRSEVKPESACNRLILLVEFVDGGNGPVRRL